jgi:hypothetical protein
VAFEIACALLDMGTVDALLAEELALYVGALVPVPELAGIGLEEDALLLGGDDLAGGELLVGPVQRLALRTLAG